MLRTVYGDPERYVRQYWSEIPGVYFTGDGAREDQDGLEDLGVIARLQEEE